MRRTKREWETDQIWARGERKQDMGNTGLTLLPPPGHIQRGGGVRPKGTRRQDRRPPGWRPFRDPRRSRELGWPRWIRELGRPWRIRELGEPMADQGFGEPMADPGIRGAHGGSRENGKTKNFSKNEENKTGGKRRRSLLVLVRSSVTYRWEQGNEEVKNSSKNIDFIKPNSDTDIRSRPDTEAGKQRTNKHWGKLDN